MALDTRVKLGLTAGAVTILAAALMQAGVLRVFGVAPNAVLVSLLVFSLFSEKTVFFVGLVLIASLFVRATPVVFDGVAVATAVIAFGAFLVERRLVWPGPVGIAILAVSGTVIFYLIIAPAFLWSHIGLVLAEALYNAVLGSVLFEIIQFFFGRGVRR